MSLHLLLSLLTHPLVLPTILATTSADPWDVIAKLMGPLTTVVATIVGLAVRQSMGRVTDSIASLATTVGKVDAKVEKVGDKVDALERDRISHAVTHKTLETLQDEAKDLRRKLEEQAAQIIELRHELSRRTMRAAQ